jgi:hypothetical protein
MYCSAYERIRMSIFDKLVKREPVLPGEIGEIYLKGLGDRANRIANYLYNKQDVLNVECLACNRLAHGEFTFDVYESPWDVHPTEKHFCSDDCQTTYLYSGGSFEYQDCPACGRTICQQNPGNGWMWQFKEYNNEEICLSCYEKIILANGIPGESFMNEQIPGMFFSGDNHELFNAGYEEEPEFHGKFIRSKESIKDFCDKAIMLINSGYKVVVAYESMGIGGGEGYVSLYKKRD